VVGVTTTLRFTRRRALVLGAGAVGAALGGPRLVGALDGAGGGELPAPARLAVARDGERVTARLRAGAVTRTVAGERARLLAYESAFPGPLLVLREGDDVRVRFANGLAEPSNLHLHGLPLSPAQDAPFTAVAPGGRSEHRFALGAGSAGTYWYHPHVHGAVARQLRAGLSGPVVVRGPLDDEPELRAADDRVLVLRELDLHEGRVLVNGALAPRLTARRSLVRLRLLNASPAEALRLALDDGPLHLIATDGGLLAAPVELGELLLSPGERAEVLVVLPRDAGRTVRLRRLPYARAGGAAGTDPETLLELRPPERPTPARLPRTLATVERLDPARAARRRRLTLGVDDFGRYLINGRPFAHDRVDADVRAGDLELWEVVNTHTTDHPFHLHTYGVQVVERDGRPEPLTAWRDVVNVRGGRSVLLAVPFRRFTGTTVFHCHVGDHEDGGMMGVVRVADRPSTARRTALAADPLVCDLPAPA
jgi:FtsP/CotA-like multicopper oxidase with cupredoxin domain